MAIKILTDSAADFLPEEAAELGVHIIPLRVSFNGTEYRDAIDIDHKKFFEMLIESDALPVTSQVTPNAFEEAMEEMTAAGDEVICIVLSSKLSGTCQSACIAAQNFEGKVHVVDSLSATVGQRLLILQALDYIRQGLPASEICDRLNEDRMHIRVLALLDTLEYLRKGGRISSAVAYAGGLLSIKPVITVNNGEVELVGKARGSKNGNNLLRKLVSDCGGIDFDRPYSLVYSGLSDVLLQKYIEDSTDLWQGYTENLPVTTIGAVIGTHVGPGAVGLAFFEK